MDFNTTIKNLQFYLDEQSFLQKITSLEILESISTPAISLLLTQNGDVFHLPEDKLFKKGIILFDDDWVDTQVAAKVSLAKDQKVKSSINLFNSFINNKMIKSGYWALFNSSIEIDLVDSILILKKAKDSTDIYDLIVIKGPMNEGTIALPSFLSSANLLNEFTYSTTPHARPPRLEHFLSYRALEKSTKLNWDMKQIRTYLGSIWCERLPSTIFSRLKLLFESAVLLAEKSSVFNKFLQIDKNKQTMVGIPSNFIIGVCGGYARGEYSKSSDLDMLLIHEGNEQQFLQVGVALDQVLRHVPNLDLCKIENLKYLNFHETSISNILQASLKGDGTYLDKHLKVELDKMLGSIEQLRKVPLSPDERKNGISKYCWSIYKSIINMVPIYEKPIGKGDYLRKTITQATKKSLHKLIPILLQVTDSLNEEKNLLGENLRVGQSFIWDSIFKKYSVLTALQDISTILVVLSDTTFTSSTIDRFAAAMEKNIITKEQAEKFSQGYTAFSRTKYKLTKEMPIESIEIINNDLRSTIKEVYENILQNLEPEESDELDEPLAYPLLVFSDLHWGLNNKLAEQCLAKVKDICDKNQVRSIIIAGDVLNIDRVSELVETDREGISLLNELSQIQNFLGDQRIHIISGNHDPERFYKKFRDKMVRELDIHFLGNHYKDDKIWVEHGTSFTPPLDQYLTTLRATYKLNNQKIIIGHIHRIYEEVESGFYANGAPGKSFSSILVTDDSIKLIKSPIEYSFDFDKILTKYSGISNADIPIDDYVQDNFDLVEGTQFTSTLRASEIIKHPPSPNAGASPLNTNIPPPPPSPSVGASPSNTNISPPSVKSHPQLPIEKKTWIVTEQEVPTHIIPFNKVEEVSKLENIRAYEVAYPIHYTFKLGQTLKEAWGVFSVSGQSILPVMNHENQIVGTLSIFSVPKPEKEHAKADKIEINEKMERVGNLLTQRLLEKQKKMK